MVLVDFFFFICLFNCFFIHTFVSVFNCFQYFYHKNFKVYSNETKQKKESIINVEI